MMKNFYEILGVDENATQDEIKKTFRSAAMKYHPDRNPDNSEAEAKFKEVNEAYETLGDENKRKHYDHMRRNPRGFGGMDDFLHDIFGGFRNQPQQHVGQDVKMTISCSLIDSLRGCRKRINVRQSNVCQKCTGTGCKTGRTKTTCPTCKGRGKVVVSQNYGANVIMQSEKICDRCAGAGTHVSLQDRCELCNDGLTYEQVDFEFDLPAGYVFGTTVRIAGKGLHKNSKTNKGDLYLQIIPEEHKIFKLDNNLNVVMDLYITSGEAILGKKILLPTIDASIEVQIPPGVGENYVVSIPNAGVSFRNGARTQQLVFVHIETPQLDDKMKELAQQMLAIQNVQTNPSTMKNRTIIDEYFKERSNG